MSVDVRLNRAIKHRTCSKDLLIAGPAGSGKTYGVLRALHVLLRDNAGLRVLGARATRAACTESWMVTYERKILARHKAVGIASGAKRRIRQTYTYPNGSELVVGGLDNPDRILSTTWDIIYINEAKEATEEAWETLRSRLSRPGERSEYGLLIGDTNPADPSHWLKSRVDRGLTELWEAPHESNPDMFDGSNWTEVGLRYRGELSTLTGTRRKRLYLGLWAAGEGAWFGESFDHDRHVSERAAYNPAYETFLAVDTGVHAGAVLFQRVPSEHGPTIHAFADHYSYDVPAYDVGRRLVDLGRSLCPGSVPTGLADPAGGARTGFGTTHIAEYGRAGVRLRPWLKFPGCVVSGLNLVESFLGGDPPGLVVHPRCERLIAAFGNYMRKRRNEQWVDEPEDPQHPHEDVMDPLRSALLDLYPEGRRPAPKLARVHAGRVF